VGTVATLLYFQYGATKRADQPPTRPAAVELLAQVGRVFIAITLGALFAGVFSAALAALIERMDAILQVFSLLVK
jgi:hypothetical protein